MMTVEIKINGSLIGHMYIHNKGFISEELNDYTCYYDYEIYMVKDEYSIVSGTILHVRKDGALKLVKKIIQDYEKNIKKQIKEEVHKKCVE